MASARRPLGLPSSLMAVIVINLTSFRMRKRYFGRRGRGEILEISWPRRQSRAEEEIR
jgi:hypothetical protein